MVLPHINVMLFGKMIFSLWSDIVKKSPDKARPYNNLANVCEKKA
jgi:hypothetical protein